MTNDNSLMKETLSKQSLIAGFMGNQFLAKILSTSLLTAVFLIISGGAYGFGEYSDEYFSEIDQPIEFNHKTHVKDNKIACEMCHTQARRTDKSGTPTLSTCIGCHISISGTTEQQQAEIAKITQYWKKQQPIEWNKIHDVPDFVIFSHKAHIRVGFDCSNCHGEVSETQMPIPQSYKGEIPLSMGWCVSCHRTDWPVTAEGKIAIPRREFRGGAVVSGVPPVVGHIKGPIDCLVCHK